MKLIWMILFLLITLSINLSSQNFTHKTTQLYNWTSPNASFYSDIWGYAANGREYAIIGSGQYIHFLDITNPLAPVLVKEFGPYSSTQWREFKTYSHYAYAVSEGPDVSGLRIFDLQYLPDSVVLVRQTNAFFSTCHMPFIDEANGRLYCAGTNTRNNGVIVLDLTQRPDSPSVVINQALPGGYIHDVYVRNNIMYASHIFSGNLSIYNCTGNTCGSQITSYTTGGLNHSSWINPSGTHIVNAVETGGHPLYLIPLTSPTSFEPAGVKRFKSKTLREQFPAGNAADTLSIGHNPYFVGNLIYASYYTDGVQIFDAADPNNIKRIAYFDTDRTSTSYSPAFRGCWGVYPFHPSGNIIASDIQTGLWIFRLNPSALALRKIDLDGSLVGNDKIKVLVNGILPKGILTVQIEKSYDGITFNRLADMNAWVEDKFFQQEFIDPSIRFVNYYRVKALADDGNFEYSEIIKVTAKPSAFVVFPNPVRQFLNYYSPEPIQKLSIIDLNGKIVLQSNSISDKLDIPTSLPNGIYILHAQSNQKNWVEKIQIQR